MSDFLKVLWKEGLLLTPQHFQANERHEEWLTNFHSRIIQPFFWGIYRMEIDTDAIANWQFKVNSLQAVMRDGTPVDCQNTDFLPPVRSFEQRLTPGIGSILVYLALPKEDPLRPGVQIEDGGKNDGQIRYKRTIHSVTDRVTGGMPREIEFIKKSPQIRLQGEPEDGFDLLPIAKVEMSSAGQPALSPGYLPPSLSLQASNHWTNLVREIFGRVNSYANGLRAAIPYRDSGKTEMVSLTLADLPTYLQARELHQSLPHLQHFFEHPTVHPLGFYEEVSGLVARLEVLFGDTLTKIEERLPPYNHENAGPGLTLLMQRLNSFLQAPKATTEVPLQRDPGDPSLWSASLAGRDIAGAEILYLLIRADIALDQLKKLVPEIVRAASVGKMRELRQFALPGTPLSEVNAPHQLPGAGGGQYFGVSLRGPRGQEIKDEKSILIEIPQKEFPGVQVNLHVLDK